MMSPRTRRRRALLPRLESLEGRVVLSVVFDSVLTVGTDTGPIMPNDNAVDTAGNTYVTGALRGPMDFDPAAVRPDGSDLLTPRGTSDAYVVKYAPDNSFVWARSMGSDYVRQTDNDSAEQGSDVRVDGAGNVFVTGIFFGQADFGPVRLTSAGNTDAFVTKLSPNGNTLWAKGWGGAGRDLAGGIALDAAGNVVSVGRSAPVNTSGGAPVDNASELRKYSPTGADVWSQRIAGPTGGAHSVATDAAGNIYVGGNFSGTTDFNLDKKKVNSITGPSGSGYVLKLTASGSFGWVSPFVSKPAEVSLSSVLFADIAVDAAGSVIVGGYYHGQVDLNPSSSIDLRLPNERRFNGVVVKLSTTGALTWARQTGGNQVNSLAVDASGAVYATGDFGAEGFTPGFGVPPVPTRGGTDAYVTKITASGSVDWALTFGGTHSDTCGAIAVDADGTIHLAGYYGMSSVSAGPSTIDFDPDPLNTHERTNAAFYDMFLLKLRQS
jgi:hypothetical protein